MDTWNLKYLAIMAKGGNQKLLEHFDKYDLNNETI